MLLVTLGTPTGLVTPRALRAGFSGRALACEDEEIGLGANPLWLGSCSPALQHSIINHPWVQTVPWDIQDPLEMCWELGIPPQLCQLHPTALQGSGSSLGWDRAGFGQDLGRTGWALPAAITRERRCKPSNPRSV